MHFCEQDPVPTSVCLDAGTDVRCLHTIMRQTHTHARTRAHLELDQRLFGCRHRFQSPYSRRSVLGPRHQVLQLLQHSYMSIYILKVFMNMPIYSYVHIFTYQVYVFIFVFVCTCICVCMYACLYACMHACMISLSLCLSLSLSLSLSSSLCACMYLRIVCIVHIKCMYACMYVCMHACMHACMRLHVFQARQHTLDLFFLIKRQRDLRFLLFEGAPRRRSLFTTSFSPGRLGAPSP